MVGHNINIDHILKFLKRWSILFLSISYLNYNIIFMQIVFLCTTVKFKILDFFLLKTR